MQITRKRKAEDENDGDTNMTRSPSASPLLTSGLLPQMPKIRGTKRLKHNLIGRPLATHRLMETLSLSQLRDLLKSVCDSHPELTTEVINTAPRPGVDSVLSVLSQYESALRDSFPFGGRESSDYAYNRVRQPLQDILSALRDYTPTFLPPNEQQTSRSFKFLDGVTDLIHRLPDWDSYQHNRHKHEAYDDISRAWTLVIQEATKRGAGIQVAYGGWDEKLAKHHRLSGNRMEEAIRELHSAINWIPSDGAMVRPESSILEQSSIRQQLLKGTYGDAVRVGPW